jgi:hypothetical protein
MNKHKQRESQQQNDKGTKEKLSEKEKQKIFIIYYIISRQAFSIVSNINPFWPNLHTADHRTVLKLLKGRISRNKYFSWRYFSCPGTGNYRNRSQNFKVYLGLKEFNIFQLSSKLPLEETRDQTHIPAFISFNVDAEPIARLRSGRCGSRTTRICQKMTFRSAVLKGQSRDMNTLFPRCW